MWQVFLSLSILVVILAVLHVLCNRDKDNKITPINTIMCAVFIANTFIFIPVYYEVFKNDTGLPILLKTVLISMHHAIRLFIVDSDFEIIRQLVPNVNSALYYIYTCYAAILFFLSPLMTFGFIFSFFKNVSAHRKYIKNYNKDVFIFSEFNEESIALATSIKNKFNNSVIVFTNSSENLPMYAELIEKAKSIKAIIFEKDILSLNFMLHSKKRDINFLLLGNDEMTNIKYALEIIKKYNKRKQTQMYVLSNDIEGEVLLNAADTEEVKVRRISNIRTSIYNVLQNNGENIFKESIENVLSDEKLISAVVIGLGRYGSEMTKSLAWFCQMEGYRVEIDAFDAKSSADKCFASICPELMDEKYNNKFDDPGESRYRIDIHNPIDVNSIEFHNEIKKLVNTTFVFVALGDDEVNINASIKLRMLFEQMGIKPRIQAVVENSGRKNALKDIKNYSGPSYDIEYVGSIDEIYSYGNIINSELEREALNRHLCWGEERDFWKYEYNYRSSMASALHKRMKKICLIPGINKEPSERTEEEKQNLRLMEHRRWNAYMRSEGYIYAEHRNNLAKTHHCLVTFDLLSQKEKEKDDD